MAKDDLAVAKINAALKILEWSKDGIEPGISGNPTQLHAALAEAFKAVYASICDAVGSGTIDADEAESDGHQEEVSVN